MKRPKGQTTITTLPNDQTIIANLTSVFPKLHKAYELAKLAEHGSMLAPAIKLALDTVANAVGVAVMVDSGRRPWPTTKRKGKTT